MGKTRAHVHSSIEPIIFNQTVEYIQSRFRKIEIVQRDRENMQIERQIENLQIERKIENMQREKNMKKSILLKEIKI